LVESAAEIIETLAPAARMLGGELAARLVADGCGRANDQLVAQGGGDGARDDSVWGRNAEYQPLLTELGHDPVTMDELVQRTGQSAAALSSMLLMLELEGRVESLPGNRYQRLPD
jgi:DNA processing protein